MHLRIDITACAKHPTTKPSRSFPTPNSHNLPLHMHLVHCRCNSPCMGPTRAAATTDHTLPAYKHRECKRGRNQALRIAKYLTAEIPACPNIQQPLPDRRKRHTCLNANVTCKTSTEHEHARATPKKKGVKSDIPSKCRSSHPKVPSV